MPGSKKTDINSVSRFHFTLAYSLVLITFPFLLDAEPNPAHNRNRITVMATSDFAGAFELNDEGSRGWSVLKTYANRVKTNRRNSATRAFLFHTGDLTGLRYDAHDIDIMPEKQPDALSVILRQGVDLLQFTGFDAVAIQKKEELALNQGLNWPSLIRFEYPNQEIPLESRPAASQKILTGTGTFLWISAIEPAMDSEKRDQQILQLREEIYRNRAADLIVLLFSGHRYSSDSHAELESMASPSPEEWLQHFAVDQTGNLFHPQNPSDTDFPSNRILILMPGKRAFFRTTTGMTVCRIPAGQLCQIEFDFRDQRLSIAQHWVAFDEALRNHSFLPADPGLQKILRSN